MLNRLKNISKIMLNLYRTTSSYTTSQALHIISKTLKIPLFKCKENAYIKLDYSRDITNPSLSEVLIEPCKRTYCQDEAEKVD